MSKTLVIVTHPNIEQSHVNKSWVEALKAHPDLYTVHEIYKFYTARLMSPPNRNCWNPMTASFCSSRCTGTALLHS